MSNVKREQGVTLIELMIVIGIIGILVAIAAPNYSQYVRTSKRTQAHTAALNAAAELEKLYGRRGSYEGAVFGEPSGADEFRIGDAQAQNSDGFDGSYSMSIVVAENGASYEITATATGPQLNDSQCRTLTYSSADEKTSTDDSGQASDDCW